MKQVATKEAKVFYSMIALLECANDMSEYLQGRNVRAVAGSIKMEMKSLFNRFGLFKRTILSGIPKYDLDKWNADFKRDYGVYSSVFEQMSEMSDEQREAVEQFATALMKNEITIVEAA